MKWIEAFLLVMIAGGVGLAGEIPPVDRNPALQYYQAFLLAPDLSPAARDYLFKGDWRGQRLPERFGELVARYDNEFKLLRAAGPSRVRCDWGIDMSPGPATLLPHLARCKAVADAARLRTLWDVDQGRPDEACEDLLAAFTLARNCSRDGTLISVLVQIAMENVVCTTIAENFYRFPASSLIRLAQGLAAAPPRRALASCVAAEKSFIHDWLMSRIARWQEENPGRDSAVMRQVRELLTVIEGPEEGPAEKGQPSLWEKVNRAAGGSSAGVVKLLRSEEPLYRRLAQILALPPSQCDTQLNAFVAEIRNAGDPFFAAMVAPWRNCPPKEFGVEAELAMLQAAVEYKMHGEEGFRGVTDPCGHGPFGMRPFKFAGVDRGFELKSAYAGRGIPVVLIFVERDGPPFQVSGRNAGEPLAESLPAR